MLKITMGINLLITILFCLVIMVRVRKWTKKDVYKSYGHKYEERSVLSFMTDDNLKGFVVKICFFCHSCSYFKVPFSWQEACSSVSISMTAVIEIIFSYFELI